MISTASIRRYCFTALLVAVTSCSGMVSETPSGASGPKLSSTSSAGASRKIGSVNSVTAQIAGTNDSGLSGAMNSNSDDSCLPFVMPSSDVMFNSAKKVFAHYFYPFPLSIDNKPSDNDYYNDQYLSPNGEANKWIQQAGFLRQRPLGVDPTGSANWQFLNMEQEVRMAIARGITGFTFDVMSITEATNANSQMYLMLKAAQAVDPRFKIVVMPDINALGTDSNAVISIIAAVAPYPSAYKLADGRLVVSAFEANANSAAWWKAVFDQLKAQGINVAFVPTFLGWQANAATFSSLTYGVGDWGTPTPAATANSQGDPAIVHNQYGQIFMAPIDPQQFRPKDFIYWEAGNSVAFRNAWTSAIAGESDWVQLVTWSDFSESSEIEPYTDSTLRRDIGTGFYDLNGYYAAWFLTGHPPTITHDVLYYFYRREPSYAIGPAQSRLDTVVNGVAEDAIELVAFLTEPGVLKINIGSQTYLQAASAGINSFKVPLQAGTPSFTLTRDGVDVISMPGAIEISGSGGTSSGVIDMTYWSGSASNSGTCTL